MGSTQLTTPFVSNNQTVKENEKKQRVRGDMHAHAIAFISWLQQYADVFIAASARNIFWVQ